MAALMRILPVLALLALAACGKSQEELNRELDREALAGNAEAVRGLLKDGATPNHADANGITPLMKAAGAGSAGAVRELIAAGADVSAKDSSGDTALLYAVTESAPAAASPGIDRPATVRELLKSGAYIEEKGKREETPLIRAAAWGSAEVVRALIQAGADLEATNSSGMTALMCAANQPHSVRDTTESVRALVKAGASKEAESDEGKTARDYAERHGSNEDMAELLQPDEEEEESGKETPAANDPLGALLSVPGQILGQLSQMDEFKQFREAMNKQGLPEAELQKMDLDCKLHRPARGKVTCTVKNGSAYSVEQFAVEFRGTTKEGGQHAQEFLFTPDQPLQPGESYTGSQDCGFTFDFDISSFHLSGAIGKKAKAPAGDSI